MQAHLTFDCTARKGGWKDDQPCAPEAYAQESKKGKIHRGDTIKFINKTFEAGIKQVK